MSFSMNTAVAHQSMTAEEFAVWAEARPERHWELFEGVPQVQQPQNWGHARHILRVIRALEKAIALSGQRLFIGSQGLIVKAGPRAAFEPDVVVFAGPMGDHDIIVPNPVIAVEVLSPSTARKDLTVKLAGYFNAPSIEHYLIVDWEDAELIHYRREGIGISKPAILREGVLELEPPGLKLQIADVFKD
jgi:Uma2 family endonuclease